MVRPHEIIHVNLSYFSSGVHVEKMYYVKCRRPKTARMEIEEFDSNGYFIVMEKFPRHDL
ncbi:hypothetical protein C0J52_09576 [Blattella germanica]|nr:hypothetical protein C0J52_09576 [Blattella germanica]